MPRVYMLVFVDVVYEDEKFMKKDEEINILLYGEIFFTLTRV